ncbi:DUF2613 domain-containing protein [Corynebacterium glucuronolyticum]
MPFTYQSLTRRTAGPAVASAVVGLVAGVAAVIGVVSLTSEDGSTVEHTVNTDDAVLGNPDYGSRE